MHMNIFTTHINYRLFLIISFALFTASAHLEAQKNAQYIYGTIYTEDGDSYEGFMRWGKEEISWHDIFNSTKTKARSNKGLKKTSDGAVWTWGDIDWSISGLWKDKYRGTNHTFACRFGDIASLHLLRGNQVKVELKNGAIIDVAGGSNDIGASIRLYDYELGKMKINWDRIETIQFKQAPSNVRDRYEPLLHGTVTTRKGEDYKGFIKWDSDERMMEDELDGDSRNGDQSIPFRNITKIEKERSGSRVTFQSGRDIYLCNSNDVDDGNRGILVYQEGVGEIDIPWNQFESVDFTAQPIGPNYDSFVSSKELEGTVVMYNGNKHEGHIIFDLDEMWDMEILDGKDGDINYQIPFRNIKTITPKNRSFSMLELRNGARLLLGDTQDVSSRNNGLLVFTSSEKKPLKIKWNDIDEIVFK